MKNESQAIYKNFEKCSNFSSIKRKQLLNKFKNMTLSSKIECFNKQYAIYMQIKNSYSKEVTQICAFFKAIANIETVEKINIESSIFHEFDENKLLDFFKKQDVFVQIKIFEEQRNQYFKNKDILKNDSLALFAFFKAIDIFNVKFKKKFYKNKTFNLESQSDIIDTNILKDKKQKISTKRERFLNYKSVVQRLKDKGYGYRRISLHFQKHYKYKVSHTYVGELCKEFLEDVDEV